MVTTLRLESFTDSLGKKDVDLDELKKRATKFMQLVELHEFQSQVQAEGGFEKPKEKYKLS